MRVIAIATLAAAAMGATAARSVLPGRTLAFIEEQESELIQSGTPVGQVLQDPNFERIEGIEGMLSF